MNPQNSFLQMLVVPFLIGLLMLGGYGVYKKNHYIMSQEPFLTHLQGDLSDTFFNLGSAQTGEGVIATDDKPTPPLSHRMLLTEADAQKKDIVFGAKDFDLFVHGNSMIISDNKSVQKVSLAGDLEWKYLLPENETLTIGQPVVYGAYLYIGTQTGKVTALDISTGSPIWVSERKENILYSPVVVQSELAIFVSAKSDQSFEVVKLDPTTGKFIKRSSSFEWNMVGKPTVTSDGILYYTTQNGHLNAVDLKVTKQVWTNESAAGYKAAPTVVGDRIYSVSVDGTILCLERTKGKKIWDLALETNIASPLHVLESQAMGAVLDSVGHLITIDLKAMKRKWRYNVQANSQSDFVSSYRLTNKSLELLQFNSTMRGWTFWTSCGRTRICLFDPLNGLLLHRIDVKSEIAGNFVWVPELENFWVPVEAGSSSLKLKLLKPWKPVDKTESKVPAEGTKESSTSLTKPGVSHNFEGTFS